MATPADISYRSLSGVSWAARVGFGLVFLINVQCAASFIADPGSYLGAYELSGVAGEAAIRGLGIAFLMWNATYPVFIIWPEKHQTLGWIIVAQQIVGLIGESILAAQLPAGHELLLGSISRFIIFDGVGLLILAGCMVALSVNLKRRRRLNATAAAQKDIGESEQL